MPDSSEERDVLRRRARRASIAGVPVAVAVWAPFVIREWLSLRHSSGASIGFPVEFYWIDGYTGQTTFSLLRALVDVSLFLGTAAMSGFVFGRFYVRAIRARAGRPAPRADGPQGL